MNQHMAVGEFKTHCLSIFEKVRTKNEKIIITKRGVPIAQISPLKTGEKKENKFAKLKNCILFEKDIVSPLEEQWEALR